MVGKGLPVIIEVKKNAQNVRITSHDPKLNTTFFLRPSRFVIVGFLLGLN